MAKIGGAIAVILILLGAGFWQEAQNSVRQVGYADATAGVPYAVGLQFTVTKLDATAQQVAGTLAMTFALRDRETAVAGQDNGIDKIGRITATEVSVGQFNAAAPSQAMLVTGQIDGEIKLLSGPFGDRSGTAGFRMGLTPIRAGFWYPYDAYLLRAVGSVGVPETKVMSSVELVDRTEVIFAVPNIRVEAAGIDKRGNDVEVSARITRPLVLQILAGVMLVLALIWIYWLIRHAKVDSQVGQLVGFFVSIWGWRSVLLGDESIFPSALDYLLLTLSVMATAIVLLRWWDALRQVTSQKCPQCYEDIPLQARICGHCRSPVLSDAQAGAE